jgi:hypothetical protein
MMQLRPEYRKSESIVATINDEARLNSCTTQMTKAQAVHEASRAQSVYVVMVAA